MSELSDKKKYEILARLSLLALYLVFFIDITLGIIAYFLQTRTGIIIGNESVLTRNIFLGLAFVELAALQFIKNVMLARVPHFSDEDAVPYQQLFTITYVVAGMCVSISVYGFIIVLFGGNFDFMLLFVAISLIGFQLFRIRKKDLDKLGT